MNIQDTQINKTTESEKEQVLKRLYELSIKSLGEIPQLADPDFEQQQWMKRKSWRTK
jgi:hypothetical protein